MTRSSTQSACPKPASPLETPPGCRGFRSNSKPQASFTPMARHPTSAYAAPDAVAAILFGLSDVRIAELKASGAIV